MHILKSYMLLLGAALLLTGFSFGKGSDACQKALELADALDRVQDDVQIRQAEAKIIAQCPDGGAAHFVSALQLERVGNVDGAIAEYKKALKQEPSFGRASGNLGLLYAQKGMNDEASVSLTRGLATVQNPHYHKAMARIFAERKVYPLATYHYNEAAKELSGDASIFAGLAEIYTATGQHDKALEEYRRAVIADPSFEKAYIASAQILLKRNNPDQALEQLKKAEAVNPQNRETHQLLAGIYEKKGDSRLADYHNLLSGKTKAESVAPPRSSEPPRQTSVTPADNNEIAALKAAVKERPRDVLSYEKLGHLYRAAGKDAEAIEAYREAAHLNSASSDVYLQLGMLYEKKSQIDEAVVAYKRAIKVDPGNAEAHLKLGDIRFSRGLFSEAVEHYSQFLKLKPDSPDIHLKLARIFAKNKENALAISSYSSVLSYSPNDIDANREIAALYKARGDNDKAVGHYRKVLDLRKDDAETRAALVAIYVKNKQYDEITLLLKEAVELGPDDPNNHYKLGLIYDFKKDYDNAVASYKKAIEIKPDHARSLNALGRLYMKSGQLDEAKIVLEAARKADPTMEETSILLSNIRDEFNPEPRKITKGKKSTVKKAQKGSKKSKATKGSKKSSQKAAKKKKTKKSK